MTFRYRFSGDAHAVVIWTDDIPALSFLKEGRGVTLNMILYEPGAGIVLRIEKGTMVVNTGVWDYTYKGELLRIWSARLDRSVVLRLRSGAGVVDVEKGTFKGGYVQLDVGRNGLKFTPTDQQFHGEGGFINGGFFITQQVQVGPSMFALE